MWPAPYCGRVFQNSFSERWRGREAELLQHARYAKARAENDFETAAGIAGEAVDLITEVLPAADVVDSIVTQAESLLAGASMRYQR